MPTHPNGLAAAPLDRSRLVAAALSSALLTVIGWDFWRATTFFGDDHLFLAFARHAASPLEPFGADRHGGEYYRPIPMALWWLLARAGGEQVWLFALVAFALHALAAGLVWRLARAVGIPGAPLAAAVFLIAPGTRDAALWFSASTDLLAAVFTLGALLALLRGGRAAIASLPLAALAYLSKESALVLPALALVALALAPAHPTRRTTALTLALPHLALAIGYLVVRHRVLGGWGGSNDPAAPAWGRALQIASGLVHALPGERFLPQPLLWAAGLAVLGLATAAAIRARSREALLPWAWVLVAVAPLPAAGWVVGSRYFYLPAVGLALMAARPLAACGPAVAGVALACLLALGSAGAIERAAEVDHYRARVAAATAAVTSQLAAGHRLVHVRGAVKDLDLVLKGQPALRGRADFLVLPDVPASFVQMPDTIAPRARFLLAHPPLPPAGAYRFGDLAIAGLARRHESPDLDEVTARLPELRFVTLVPDGRGGVTWRDVTEERR